MHRARMAALFAALMCVSPYGFTKRAAPAPVTPVVRNGVRYVAPHVTPGYIETKGYPVCPIGCVEAWSAHTEQFLWRVQVYTVQYVGDLESDVQDVFIRSLAIKNGELLVENERGAAFRVNLKRRTVKKLAPE